MTMPINLKRILKLLPEQRLVGDHCTFNGQMPELLILCCATRWRHSRAIAPVCLYLISSLAAADQTHASTLLRCSYCCLRLHVEVTLRTNLKLTMQHTSAAGQGSRYITYWQRQPPTDMLHHHGKGASSALHNHRCVTLLHLH